MVSLPSPGPLSNNDYIDLIWLKTAQFDKQENAGGTNKDRVFPGLIAAAGEFKPNGSPVKGAATASASKSEPVFTARVKTGLTVYPVVHSAAGYVWEGAPITL